MHSKSPCGVLYVNLGSPAAPTPSAVRAFLDEFLGDPLVVDTQPVLWWFVRKFLILPRRSPVSAALYRRVWTADGSPLTSLSRRFAQALARELGREFRVVLAMRYGSPTIEAGVAELVAAGCERVVLFTAFPQASRTTTGTVEREFERVLASRRLDAVRVPPYYADPGYLEALAARVRVVRRSEPLVLSFHGLPVRYVAGGDPYEEHCRATAQGLRAVLGLSEDELAVAYQSRFGREPWLTPDVAEVVPVLAAAQGRVIVCAPSFTTDCLETLEELGLRLAEECRERGAELGLVPSLNDDPAWVRAAAALVRRAGAGLAPRPA